MKKILAMLSVMLFSVCAFALNAETPANGKCPGKAAFEKYAASQENISHIAQYILINFADPMAEMSYAQATCYATYQVKGQSMVEFVKENADIFPGDVSGKEANKLRDFAARVEVFAQHDKDIVLAETMNDYFFAQHVLFNVADPFNKLSKEEATAKAKAYKDLKVKGKLLVDFAEEQGQMYDEFEGLLEFANRVRELAK